MTTTTTKPRTPASPDTTTIDATEVAWAAAEIATLLRRANADTVVGMVLQQTLRELNSLKQSAEASVVGPFRLKAAI